MSSRATFLESVLGGAKYYHSRFFHVFENCFGPPHAGELKFEHIPRITARVICTALGPRLVRKLTPKSWIKKSEQTSGYGATIGEWLPLQIANFGTWPKYIPTVRYPPPPAEVVGSPCRVTYCGHSSVLIQTQESNVMIDPYFGMRAGPRFVMGSVEVMGGGG